MTKIFFFLAILATLAAGAAIFTPAVTVDDARHVANDLKTHGVEGSQAHLAGYLQAGKPTVYGPGIGERVFGDLADKP